MYGRARPATSDLRGMAKDGGIGRGRRIRRVSTGFATMRRAANRRLVSPSRVFVA
jgi:hypothetical protein